MKLELIVRNEKALQTLSEVKMKSAQAAWDMAEALEQAQKNLKRYHDERNTIIKTHGKEKKSEPGQFEIPDLKKFNEALQDLMKVEVGIKFPKIFLSELNGSEISPGDMIGWRDLGIIKSNEDDSTKEKNSK
jgi:hypothetical protein